MVAMTVMTHWGKLSPANGGHWCCMLFGKIMLAAKVRTAKPIASSGEQQTNFKQLQQA
jgi:quinol-cytochrome oxidoreductase complex cytochrome b subunit